MTRALTDPAFAGFARKRVPKLAAFATLTSYGDEFAKLPAAFTHGGDSCKSFGEVVASHGWPQNSMRIAETEKYATHVTYFFQWRGRASRIRAKTAVLARVAQGRHIRSETGDERLRGHRQAGRCRHRRWQVRRNRLQLTPIWATWWATLGNFDARKASDRNAGYACVGRVVEAQLARGGRSARRTGRPRKCGK